MTWHRRDILIEYDIVHFMASHAVGVSQCVLTLKSRAGRMLPHHRGHAAGVVAEILLRQFQDMQLRYDRGPPLLVFLTGINYMKAIKDSGKVIFSRKTKLLMLSFPNNRGQEFTHEIAIRILPE